MTNLYELKLATEKLEALMALFDEFLSLSEAVKATQISKVEGIAKSISQSVENITNLQKQANGLLADLNAQNAEILNNFNKTAQNATNEILSTKNSAVENINEFKNSAVQNINELKGVIENLLTESQNLANALKAEIKSETQNAEAKKGEFLTASSEKLQTLNELSATLETKINEANERINNFTNTIDGFENFEALLQSKADTEAVYKKSETFNQSEINEKLDLKADKTELQTKADKTELQTLKESVNAEITPKLTEIGEKIDLKANSADMTTELNKKADVGASYTKSESDDKYATITNLNLKANLVDMTTQLDLKTDIGTSYTKSESDDAFIAAAERGNFLYNNKGNGVTGNRPTDNIIDLTLSDYWFVPNETAGKITIKNLLHGQRIIIIFQNIKDITGLEVIGEAEPGAILWFNSSLKMKDSGRVVIYMVASSYNTLNAIAVRG